MLKKLTTKGRKRLAQILSIILEGIILYVLILTWTKAGLITKYPKTYASMPKRGQKWTHSLLTTAK